MSRTPLITEIMKEKHGILFTWKICSLYTAAAPQLLFTFPFTYECPSPSISNCYTYSLYGSVCGIIVQYVKLDGREQHSRDFDNMIDLFKGLSAEKIGFSCLRAHRSHFNGCPVSSLFYAFWNECLGCFDHGSVYISCKT